MARKKIKGSPGKTLVKTMEKKDICVFCKPYTSEFMKLSGQLLRIQNTNSVGMISIFENGDLISMISINHCPFCGKGLIPVSEFDDRCEQKIAITEEERKIFKKKDIEYMVIVYRDHKYKRVISVLTDDIHGAIGKFHEQVNNNKYSVVKLVAFVSIGIDNIERIELLEWEANNGKENN